MNYDEVYRHAVGSNHRSGGMILFAKSGSRSYGLEHDQSDWDAHGIYVGPRGRYLGYREREEQYSGKDKDRNFEYTVYEIQKFFFLASACNPNVIEILFVDDEGVIWSDDYGKRIRSSRDKFLCNRARYSFTGYAMSQLKRIETHRGWLLNPPKRKPVREDYGLAQDVSIGNDMIVEIDKAMSDNSDLVPAEIRRIWGKERSYQSAKHQYEQYERWKSMRNPKRAELEHKFGYDTHHAKHLMRLLTAGEELLATGVLPVRLTGPRKDLVVAVASGGMSYQELLETGQKLHDRVMSMDSVLPEKADHETLDAMCTEIVHEGMY